MVNAGKKQKLVASGGMIAVRGGMAIRGRFTMRRLGKTPSPGDRPRATA
jgi:hypothetical protein